MSQREPSRKAGDQSIVVAGASNEEGVQPVLHVYLLGHFRFEQADGTALNVHAALGRPHCIILFKLLLCHPERRVSRTQLTEAIWPGQSYASIGGSLDTAKSVLKTRLHAVCGQTLMPRVNGDPPSFVLAGQPLLWTDIDASEQYMRQAVNTGDPEQALSLWEAAYTLLRRGVLLADDQDTYWYQTHLVQQRRQKLAKQRVQCALRVADLALEGGNLDRAVAVLSEESEVNPTNEEIALHLMELLAQYGRNTEALACYARLEAVLLEQDAAPWQATRKLAQHLRSTEATRVSVDRHALFSHLQGTERQIGRERETGALSPRSELPIPRQAPSLWTIPYPRNPFFTGREELLAYIHDQLHQTTTVAVTQTQAICGLGGIGKTQTAIEYAYRYQEQYRAVLWMKADMQENLLADFIALATLLALPERDASDQSVTIQAVKRWLREHSAWLLIIDNADDLSILKAFLVPGHRGHILLTTRAQAPGGLAQRAEIETMSLEEGTLFLLRRAALISPQATLQETPAHYREPAQEIVYDLGGLPLALDQAGAYIEESCCHPADYLRLYRRQRSALLARRGGLMNDHPEPVATTWSLSFRQIEQTAPLAADLLRFCAFLDPDAIPEEILSEGPEATPLDPLRMNEALAVLLRFSLIRRNIETRSLTIHRLVQAVIQDTMDKDVQRDWAEKVILAVSRTFPCLVTVGNWQTCQRCLPHVQVCTTLVDEYKLSLPEAATLFNQAGYYLRERAFYVEAESLYQRSLTIRETVLGIWHPDTAQVLHNIGRLHFDLGQYTLCEQFNLRALTIREKVLLPDDIGIALSLNSLAFMYYVWGIKLDQAEQLFQRALSIFERTVSLDHPQTSHCLSNLAWLYATQGKYAQAEELFLRVRTIRDKFLGPFHLDTARRLQNLACLYLYQGNHERYEEAQGLLEQSLEIREALLGSGHPQTAISLHNLALLYDKQQEYDKAEQLYQRVLTIRRQIMGKDNPKVLLAEKHYAALLKKTGRQEEAARLERHIQAVQGKDEGLRVMLSSFEDY